MYKYIFNLNSYFSKKIKAKCCGEAKDDIKNLKSKSEYERMELLGAPDGSVRDNTGTLDGDDEEYSEEMSSDVNEEEVEDVEETNLSPQKHISVS